MKILIIGDTHFKDNLGYADHISDRREGEKKEILDFLVSQSNDCDHIVFLGDFFNSKNNSSEVNRQAVELIERFGNKEVYIIAGNHEKKGDGSTAIDFLKEVKKSNWHIYTKITKEKIGTLNTTFLPYMLNSEVSADNSSDAAKNIMKQLEGGDLIFLHHAVTGSTTGSSGISVGPDWGIALSQKELEEKYTLIVGGHIHKPQAYGKVLITGNLFTTEVGEIERFVFKLDEELNIEKIKVPAREIHKLVNPTKEILVGIPHNSIVKVVLTDKNINVDHIKSFLEVFDASLLIEDYPNERVKAHVDEGAFDFSIESLLELYSKAKKVDYQKLINGLHIINNG